MGTEPRTLRIDAQRNREAVIDAALELLSAQPNASMAAIAASSGVGRTTVYRHFPAREDLIRAIFERVVVEAQAATSQVVSAERPTREVLNDLGPAIVGIGRRFQFLEGVRQLGADVVAESTFDPDDPVRTFLLAAQRRGEVRAELPVQWMCTSINALAGATMVELGSGRVDVAEAGRLLGEAFVRTFAA